jgi:hypothetical protein
VVVPVVESVGGWVWISVTVKIESSITPTLTYTHTHRAPHDYQKKCIRDGLVTNCLRLDQ